MDARMILASLIATPCPSVKRPKASCKSRNKAPDRNTFSTHACIHTHGVLTAASSHRVIKSRYEIRHLVGVFASHEIEKRRQRHVPPAQPLHGRVTHTELGHLSP